MGNNILEIRGLRIEYCTEDGVVKAVNGIDLDLAKGETLGLVGETGAGKTTTALGIMNLIPDPPGKIVGGQIFFEGEDLLNISDKAMRKIRGDKISMIFQDPMTALNPILTIGEQIAEAIRLHKKLSRADAQEEAIKMLEMVGIKADRFNDYPHQFSGGMKQRVVIAIALSCMPDLLIADEPTTALDVTIQAQVLDLMRNLRTQMGSSMILITHDLGVVAEICDKVSIMYAGEIVESGTLEHIFENTAHPYTKGLFESIPSMDKTVERLKPIKGYMPDPSKLPEGCKFADRCPYCTEACRSFDGTAYEVEPGHYVKCLLHATKG